MNLFEFAFVLNYAGMVMNPNDGGNNRTAMTSSNNAMTSSNNVKDIPQRRADNPYGTCDLTALSQDLQTCGKLPGLNSSSSANSTRAQFCENIECVLECLIDAVGDCYENDFFFNLEPVVRKVGYRSQCENLEVLDACLETTSDTTCVQTYMQAVSDAVIAFVSGGDSAIYKQTVCSAIDVMLGCVDVPVQGDCTAARATILKDIVIAAYSYTACGRAQDHPYFDQYGGELACGAARLTETIMLRIFGLLLVYGLYAA